MTSGDAGGLSHAELVKLVVALSEQYEALALDNERLRAENVRLRSEAAKNSGNSSKPPSRDPAAERRRQAEERQAKKARAAGGKKRRPGKQPGASGNTLEMSDSPDEVIDYAPEACAGCGAGLDDAEVTAVARRQVIDIPLPAPVVTEHRAQTRRCGCCGAATTASFPDAVRAPVSYGPRVRAIVVYLLARQHIPVQRTAEAMAELFGVPMAPAPSMPSTAMPPGAWAASSPPSWPGCARSRCCTRTSPPTGSGPSTAGCTWSPPGSTP